MSFGWARAEVVAALVNYVALVLVALRRVRRAYVDSRLYRG